MVRDFSAKRKARTPWPDERMRTRPISPRPPPLPRHPHPYVDAVAEAAVSYAKGVGCQRDMKKAAELYRRADGIRKEKYLEGGGGRG